MVEGGCDSSGSQEATRGGAGPGALLLSEGALLLSEGASQRGSGTFWLASKRVSGAARHVTKHITKHVVRRARTSTENRARHREAHEAQLYKAQLYKAQLYKAQLYKAAAGHAQATCRLFAAMCSGCAGSAPARASPTHAGAVPKPMSPLTPHAVPMEASCSTHAAPCYPSRLPGAGCGPS